MLTARARGLLVAMALGSTAPVTVCSRMTRPLLCPVACAVTRYACTPCAGTTYDDMHSGLLMETLPSPILSSRHLLMQIVHHLRGGFPYQALYRSIDCKGVEQLPL